MLRAARAHSLLSALYTLLSIKKIPRRMHRWQVIQKGTVGYFILRTMASVIMTGDPCHDTSETLVSADAMSADMLL